MARGLLIVDLQNDIVDGLDRARRDEMIANVGALAAGARRSGTPVVHVRHGDDYLKEGEHPWEIAEPFAPQGDEPVVDKRSADAFHETTLAEVLEARGIDHVVVCGMQSDMCIDATVRGAIARGIRATLARDAHATYAANGKTEADIRADIEAGLRDAGVELVSAREVFVEA